LEEAKSLCRQSLKECAPLSDGDHTSPWLISDRGVGTLLRKMVGESEYRPHKGCDTSGANGIFWVQALGEAKAGLSLVRNMGDAGRIHKFEVIERSVESQFIFPLLRGRDVSPWIATPSCRILCAQSESDFSHATSEATLKRLAPRSQSHSSLKRNGSTCQAAA
jgi:hypothetical protein